MKNLKIYSLLIYSFGIIVLFSSFKETFSEDIISIENGKIELSFEKKTGKLVSFSDVRTSYEFIESASVKELPWKINYNSPTSSSSEGKAPLKFTFSKPDPLTLLLLWGDFEGIKDYTVEVTVKLDENKALSYWDIDINGIDEKVITDVVFPRIAGLKDMGNEQLLSASWMGSLIKEPRKMLSGGSRKIKWVYPGALSSQVLALYNPEKIGFYASCNDSLSYAKNFSFQLDTLNTLVYEMVNFPIFDSTLVSYSPSYEAVIGSFKGDWFTVADIYGEWATKQKWVRESRFKNGLTPSWLENTALWVWNRGESDNVIKPAIDLKERLGLPVNVIWHWWHKGSYDDSFPNYLPPREGKESFVNAMQLAQQAGIKAHVYMNALQWGDITDEWKTGTIQPHTIKDIQGNMDSHVYNIFTGNALTGMCVGTEFWKDHYSSLCDSVVNVYQANGVYMDQTCLSRMCFDHSHGHPIGGGNYWVENSGKLIKQIRSKDFGDKQPIFTGEGSSENWLPHLDAFLTLEASRERYGGVGSVETVPFFQAVYHQYGITFGSYSSLVSPPYDEMWPQEFAPENPEYPLDEKYNKQFLMEQARSFVWGMQPTIANYHSFLDSERKEEIDYLLDVAKLRYKRLKYLLYGKFLKSPTIDIPEREIDISKLSIYVGRGKDNVTAFKKGVPLLYTGTWKAEDNNLGIAIASIGDDAIPIVFNINAKDYDLSENGEVYILTVDGRELINSYKNGAIKVELSIEPRGLCIIEIVPFK